MPFFLQSTSEIVVSWREISCQKRQINKQENSSSSEMAVEEVVGGQRDTFVISDMCCMSSAQSCSQYFFILFTLR